MSRLGNIIDKLFSRKIIIKQLPTGRLKTIDFDKLQSINPMSGGRFAGVKSSMYRNSGYSSGNTMLPFNNFDITSLDAQRRGMYADYDMMDTDAILSAALDVYSDECLGSETKIPLLNGDVKTIQELHDENYVNFWVYGLDDDGNFKPVQCERVKFNGYKEVYKILLDDGTEIISTGNHEWVTSTGKLITTDNLQQFDSLKVLKTSISNKNIIGYKQIEYDNKQVNVHTIVSNLCDIDVTDNIKRPVIHHKDFNKLNNEPANLLRMDWDAHLKLHYEANSQMWDRRRNDPDWMTKFRNRVRECHDNYWTPELRSHVAERQRNFMHEYTKSIAIEERKSMYGLPGKRNGMYNNGHKLQGEKNGRFIKGLDRNINVDDVIQLLIRHNYSAASGSTLFSILQKYYIVNKMISAQVARKICQIFNIKSLKHFNQAYYSQNYLNVINILRKNNIKTVPEAKSITGLTYRQLMYNLKRANYNTFGEFINSGNHRVISIEKLTDTHAVYDLINTGDNHIFGIETNDGSILYTHNCTVKNEQGRLLTIQSDNEIIKQILHNLYFDILNIEFNLWHWVRTICKYGDLFIYIPSKPSIGIMDAIPIHPGLMSRLDYQGENKDETQYSLETEQQSFYTASTNNQNIYKYHEIAHFRILTDTMFIPYGRSMLEGARKTWKQLSMMEDAMLIHRIMRAPERRIFKLDVGNLPEHAIDGYIDAVSSQMKKIPYVDPETGEYNLKFNLMNMLEDFFLPTRGGESSTDITTLEGLTNDGGLEDIEYLRTKMMAFLKIPKSYLGYDEGVEGKGTLAAEDIKFARFIERVQRIIVSELEKIGMIHLYMQGYSEEEVMNFKLQLSTPSLIYERQKIDLLNEKTELAKSMQESNLFSEAYIYENIYMMNREEWEVERKQVVEDKKRVFRLEQITSEGNDPEKTKKAVGTPASIVQMQMAGRVDSYVDTYFADKDKSGEQAPDGRMNNTGRPKKQRKFERDSDNIFGRDPIGRKAASPVLNADHVDTDHILNNMESNIVRLDEESNKK